MKKRNFLFFFLFVLIKINAQFVIDKTRLEKQIDELIPSKISNNTPGVVVGIIQNNKLIFTKSYGLSNLTYNIPNTTKTLFNIGSNSKQFIGYAFAILHEKGKLNLDDSVTKYVKRIPEFNKKITIRHLLSHTTGYRDAYTISNLAGRTIGVDYFDKEEVFKTIKRQKKLEFEPGFKHVYNSASWVILVEVLEQVTRNLADDWIKSNIFKPLEMNDTYVENFVGEVIPNSAESYVYDTDKGFIATRSNRAIFGAANIYTSLEDLTKWVINFGTAKLAGDKVNKLFFNPYKLTSGASTKYGLGIGIGYFHEMKRYRHIGRHGAFESDITYFPEQKIGFITLSNFGAYGTVSTSRIAEKLLKGDVLEVKESKQDVVFNLKKGTLRKFSGLYVGTNLNKKIDIDILDDTLAINNRLKLIPTAENEFQLKNRKSFKITFHNSRLEAERNGIKDVYLKVPKWNPNRKELAEYQGIFWSDEIETAYSLILRGEELIIKHRWLGMIELTPLTKDVFSSSKDYFIHFIRNEKQEIVGFDINTEKTLKVFFEKK